jgi:uncharacterized protein (TIGR03437 family)
MKPEISSYAAPQQDNNTLLYLGFDNTLTGADGEVPTQTNGITFQPGIFNAAAYFPVGSQLHYATQNNINVKEGTFEVWVKPDWSGADGKYYHLLEVRNSAEIEIFKDSDNFLNLIVPLKEGRGWPRFSISDWSAATWRHLVFTWSESGKFARIYVNGVKKAEATFTNSILDSTQTSMRIGSYSQSNHFEGLMDELRISNVAITDTEVSRRFFSRLPVTALTPELSSLHLYPTWRWWPIYTATTPLGVFQADAGAFTLVSSNSAVARIDESGRIVAVGAGTAEITATLNGQLAKMSVLVKAPVKQPEITVIDPHLAAPASGYLYQVPVIILRFLPTADGETIDPAHSPEMRGQRISDVIGNVERFDRRIKFMLEEGSRFRGYKDATSPPALGYRVVQYITVYEAHPPSKKFSIKGGKPAYFVDYEAVFNRFDIPRLINERGVKEVWVWENNVEAGGPGYDPSINRPEFLRTGWESNMSSPIGDISNSDQDNSDLPIYNRTYVVYGQNLTRTQAEAVHNHGHQLEAMLSYANKRQDGNTDLFWRLFARPVTPGATPQARCGNTHFPPNATADYQYDNTTFVASDIIDWNPLGGPTTMVNSATWGSVPYPWPGGQSPTQEVESKWYIFWMQSMPGRNNVIPYQNNRMTNWWHFTADWDAAMKAGIGLYEPGTCAYSLSSTSKVIGSSGGTGSVNVASGAGCKWMASSNAEWIQLTSGPAGNGDGTINFNVAPNDSPDTRSATIAIAGQVFTVTQGSQCSLSLNPKSLPVGTPGVAYTPVTFSASGGTTPYTFTQGGALPGGISFDASASTLSGVPTQSGNFEFTIRAADANGCSVVNTYVLAIINDCVPSPPSSVSWWPGDGNANDIAGSNSGVMRNSATFAAGKVGPGFSFDGMNDSILVGHSASLNLNQHTIDAWINPGVQQGADYHGILVKQNPDNSGRNYYIGLRTDGRIHYSISFPSSLSSIDSKAVIPTDAWAHVAATFDGKVMRIFINGQLDSFLNVGDVTPVKTSQPLLIGHTNENASTFFKGLIDEIELYNRALSEAEIRAIWAADKAGKCKDCRQVYSNNFEDGNRVGPEWRVYDTCDHERCNSTPLGLSGEAFLGRYRFFVNESCTPRAPTNLDNKECPDGGTVRRLNQNDVILTLTQNALGNHNTVNVAFDLYIIGQWSGGRNETWELKYDNGVDTPQMTLVSRRFTNISGLQKQPFNLTFSHPNGQQLRLIFSARGLGPVDEASWGLDNVTVTICSAIGSCANVSAASYTAPLAGEALASAFGVELATMTASAEKIPLPLELAGTTIKVKDSAGVERLAPLFFVSPLQSNYQIPPGTANGMATVSIMSGDGSAPVCLAQISTVAPGLFTADATGSGLPAAEVLRVRSNGSRSSEPVARFNQITNKFEPVAIDLGPEGDQVFLILYGTGIRKLSSLSAVTVTVGGLSSQVTYAGGQGQYVGLDQVNLLLPRGLAGRGEVDVVLSVHDQTANTVKVTVK